MTTTLEKARKKSDTLATLSDFIRHAAGHGNVKLFDPKTETSVKIRLAVEAAARHFAGGKRVGLANVGKVFKKVGSARAVGRIQHELRTERYLKKPEKLKEESAVDKLETKLRKIVKRSKKTKAKKPKKTGIGSRGGKVIRYTITGRPVYLSSPHKKIGSTDSKKPIRMIFDHKDHEDFNSDEHKSAAYEHARLAHAFDTARNTYTRLKQPIKADRMEVVRDFHTGEAKKHWKTYLTTKEKERRQYSPGRLPKGGLGRTRTGEVIADKAVVPEKYNYQDMVDAARLHYTRAQDALEMGDFRTHKHHLKIANMYRDVLDEIEDKDKS